MDEICKLTQYVACLSVFRDREGKTKPGSNNKNKWKYSFISMTYSQEQIHDQPME